MRCRGHFTTIPLFLLCETITSEQLFSLKLKKSSATGAEINSEDRGPAEAVQPGRLGRPGESAERYKSHGKPIVSLMFAAFRGGNGAETKTVSEASLHIPS